MGLRTRHPNGGTWFPVSQSASMDSWAVSLWLPTGKATLKTFSLGPRCTSLPFFGEGSCTKIDYRKKGTLIRTSQIWRT